MRMILCVPCVKTLDSRRVKRASGNSQKETCQMCGRRRYCGQWDVDEKGAGKNAQ